MIRAACEGAIKYLRRAIFNNVQYFTREKFENKHSKTTYRNTHRNDLYFDKGQMVFYSYIFYLRRFFENPEKNKKMSAEFRCNEHYQTSGI